MSSCWNDNENIILHILSKTISGMLDVRFTQNVYLIFRTADSKLNNFTRIEPVMKLLEIPYDTNVVSIFKAKTKSTGLGKQQDMHRMHRNA